MPSNPASFASRRHCSSVIFSGYGNAHRLIDFLNGYFFRGFSGAFGCAPIADAPSAAAEVANSSRRSGEYGPDMGNLLCRTGFQPVLAGTGWKPVLLELGEHALGDEL